jgi:hypothetical protein
MSDDKGAQGSGLYSLPGEARSVEKLFPGRRFLRNLIRENAGEQ